MSRVWAAHMIWNSIPTMIVLDSVIIGLVVTMLFVSRSLGMFRKSRIPRTGRFLIMAGASLTGLFYVADLLVMTIPSSLIEHEKAMSLMRFLHLEFRWPISVISLTLIAGGVMVEAYLRQRVEKQIRKAERSVDSARERIVESEIRFRSVVENSANSVFCFEFDPPVLIESPIDDQVVRSYGARLVECNRLFADSVTGQPVEETLGLKFGEMDSATHTVSHTRLFRDFIYQGYRLDDYELKYSTPDNEPRALLLSMTGIIRDGELHRIWGSERDVLAEHQTKAALAGRLHFEQLIKEISLQLLTAADHDAETAMIRCLEQVGKNIKADGAAIVGFTTDGKSSRNRFSWSKAGGSASNDWSPSEYPWLCAQLLAGETVRIASVAEPAIAGCRDASSLKDLGVGSLVGVPLLASGTSIGACIFTDVRGQHELGDQDMSDLRVLANLFASKLMQIDDRSDLGYALSELRVAKDRLEAENVCLREEISSTHGFPEIVGESKTLLHCLNQVSRVAVTDSAVLLQGETGTGKELVARAIHESSERKGRPMVKVNCAALPTSLIESELFGHEKGAFTDAVGQRAGRFELADGGTLFLDEIAELPLEVQSKLLRVLQCGEFERLGGATTLTVDTRIIAATNRDLHDAVGRGTFRPDLFYRINVFPITLPALRDRGNDVALLAAHFVHKHSSKFNKNITEIAVSAMEQLLTYDWPGNVRQLEGVIQRALVFSTGPILELAEPLRSVAGSNGNGNDKSAGTVTDLRSIEREHIRSVLEQSEWIITGAKGAAQLLGVPPSTLRSKMKKLGIMRPS